MDKSCIEVNSLTYDLLEFEVDGQKFDIKIKINEKKPKEMFGDIADFCFSPIEFHASLKEKERDRFFIFTCGCGDAGCDGWGKGVLVKKEDKKITWLMDEGFIVDRKLKPIELVFNLKDYENFDLKLRKDIEYLAKRKPNILLHRAQGEHIKYIIDYYKKY